VEVSDTITKYDKWCGPPGCTCDMSLPAKDRCTKGGWIRCQGAWSLVVAQQKYRDKVGDKGGDLFSVRPVP